MAFDNTRLKAYLQAQKGTSYDDRQPGDLASKLYWFFLCGLTLTDEEYTAAMKDDVTVHKDALQPTLALMVQRMVECMNEDGMRSPDNPDGWREECLTVLVYGAFVPLGGGRITFGAQLDPRPNGVSTYSIGMFTPPVGGTVLRSYVVPRVGAEDPVA